MHLTVSSEGTYKQQLAQAKEAGFVKPDEDASYERMKDFVTRGEYTISIPTEHHVLTENEVFGLDSATPFATLLIGYDCQR